MLLFFSNGDIYSENMKKIWYAILEESSTRRPYWIFHGDELKDQTRKLVLKFQKPLIDDVCLKRFELDYNFDMIHKNLFIKDLKTEGLYSKIYEIIKDDKNIIYSIHEMYYESVEPDDEDFNNIDRFTRRMQPFHVLSRMESDFKKIYNECEQETKDKVNKILQKLMFSYYFDTKEEDGFKKYEELTEKRNELYDNYKVNELLKDKRITNMDEILKYLFDNQKGNKLFIITFFTAKKIEDKEFMKELENNYGIYLDVETFIKEMNQKLKEITSLHQMYEYIGSEYGKNKTDLEIIIESYEKAKKKGYIGHKVIPMIRYNNRSECFRNNRGRGGGRGRGTRGIGGRWGLFEERVIDPWENDEFFI